MKNLFKLFFYSRTKFRLFVLTLLFGSSYCQGGANCKDSSSTCSNLNVDQCLNPLYKRVCCKSCSNGGTSHTAAAVIRNSDESCTDVNPGCSVVVKLEVCDNFYYGQHCCASCRKAGFNTLPDSPTEPAVPPTATAATDTAFNPVPECGKRFATHSFLQPGETPIFTEREIFDNKIFGGREADPNSWPWMALLGKLENGVHQWKCGGSLISDSWILTAAHCLLDNLQVVRLGEHDITKPEPQNTEADYKIESYLWFPGYQARHNYHDIGLIKFQHVGKLPPRFRPICLPWGDNFRQNLIGNEVTVTGWGARNYLGSMSSVLREVSIDIYDYKRCESAYSRHRVDFNRKWPKGMDGQTTLCAGHERAEGDACQGDSGGPMVAADHERFTVLGVVSLGYGCGHEDYPGIYAPVYNEAYLKWIREKVFGNN